MIEHAYLVPGLDKSVSLGRQLTAQAMQTFSGWGYREIQVPLLDYFDSLKRSLDESQIARSFRFVDRQGNVMVLRPDITPAVAKIYAYQLRGMPLPVRVCYHNKVVRIERSFHGSQLESYQMGVELIGAQGLAADVEVLLVALEVMERAGLTQFQVNVADHEVAQHLLSATGAPSRIRERVEQAILARDADDVRHILESVGTRRSFVEAIATMAGLEGDLQQLERIQSLLPHDAQLARRLDYLRQLRRTLDELGYGRQVRLDMAALDGASYYTGIGFTVVSEGAGRELARGGRYDGLVGLFGPPTPAVGFSFSLEAMMELLHPQMASLGGPRQDDELVAVDPAQPLEGFKRALERRQAQLPTRVNLRPPGR